jgi:hypothetical protein
MAWLLGTFSAALHSTTHCTAPIFPFVICFWFCCSEVLEVRKIKTNNTKLCFVTLISAGSSQEDFRCKLLAQHNNNSQGRCIPVLLQWIGGLPTAL